MDVQLVQISVVVVGRTHNPSLLNPDFLTINGIVAKDWGWEVAETITTPPLAMVRYTNGVTVTVEHSKFQVVDTGIGEDPTASRIPDIARAYVATLPHVRYTAVGINLHSVAQHDAPGSFLKGRFLKPGPWDRRDPSLAGVGVRFLYPLDGGRLVMSLDAGEAETVEEDKTIKKEVVLVNGNFHRDCRSYPAKDEVSSHIDKVESDWTMYRTLVKEILDNGG